MTITELMNEIPSLEHLDRATDEEVKQAEIQLGCKFAEDYKEYLKHFRLASWDGTEFTGLSRTNRLNVVDATKRVKAKFASVPDNFYVVEFLNIDDVIVWQSSDGSIYQSVLNQKPVKIANSLADYIHMKEDDGGK